MWPPDGAQLGGAGTTNPPPPTPWLSPPQPPIGQGWNVTCQCTGEEMEAFALIDKYAGSDQAGLFLLFSHQVPRRGRSSRRKRAVLRKNSQRSWRSRTARPSSRVSAGRSGEQGREEAVTGFLGVRGPSFTPCKVAIVSFHLQSGETEAQRS